MSDKETGSERVTLGMAFMKASEAILKHTCQLFIIDPENDVHKNWGTGVFICHDENYFLISATHVLNNKSIRYLHVPHGDRLISLSGQLEYTAMPETKRRSDDRVDIAILKMDMDLVNDLNPVYDFLPVDRVEPFHETTDRPEYLVCGFPSAFTEKKMEDDKLVGVKAKAVLFRTAICKHDLKDGQGLSDRMHIIVDYPTEGKEVVKTGESIHAHPRGMSGSGLWHIPKRALLAGEANPSHLLGIAIEYIEVDQVIVSTRIDIIIDVLRQRFGLNIPNPSISPDSSPK